MVLCAIYFPLAFVRKMLRVKAAISTITSENKNYWPFVQLWPFRLTQIENCISHQSKFNSPELKLFQKRCQQLERDKNSNEITKSREKNVLKINCAFCEKCNMTFTLKEALVRCIPLKNGLVFYAKSRWIRITTLYNERTVEDTLCEENDKQAFLLVQTLFYLLKWFSARAVDKTHGY